MISSSKRITRRKMLLSISASIPLMTVSGAVGYAGSAGVHSYAAQQAIGLAAGRKIELNILIPNGSGANIGPVIAAFEQATGISIKPTEAPVDDINVELTLNSLSDNDRFDLALPATFGVPDLVSSGSILSLTHYAQKHEPAGFRDQVLYQTGDRFDDDIYGFQADGDAYVMFYRKDLLTNPYEQARFSDRYGYALDIPETWEALDQQIEFFNRPDEGLSGGLLFRTPDYLAWEWWVRFHAKGYWPLSDDLTPQIASDAGVTALEEMIRVSEHLHPDAGQLGLFENWERYARGDTFCNIGWGGSQKYFNAPASKIKDNLLFGPTPGGMVNGELLVTPYFNWGWNYVVTSGSREPEISYLFALFASSTEMSTLAVQQADGFFDPFRKSHYQNENIREAYSEAFLDVHSRCMENAIPDLYLAHQGEYFAVLGRWLYRAYQREVTPETALQRVSEDWGLISFRSGFEKQRRRWNDLQQKYPADARARLRNHT